MPNVRNLPKSPRAKSTEIDFVRNHVNPIMGDLHTIPDQSLRDRVALLCGLAMGYAMRAEQCEKERDVTKVS